MLKPKSTQKSTQPAKPPKQGCADKGEPVDAIHGLVYYDLTDFEYPGVIPFSWTRSWNSGNAWPGALGYGTGLLYSMYIKREKTLVFVNEKGRKIYFDLLEAGETTVRRDEQLSLTCGVEKHEIFNHETRLRYVFEGKEGATVYQLSRIETETGEHAIVLDYDGESRLSGMTDTAGRHFEITANATGQITKVKHDGRTLVEYAYDGKLNLTGVTDVNGAKSTIYYKNHLMIKRVTRNGDTFQWEYDGEDENARCIHTWGDNGLLEGWFEYSKDHTAYTNSLRSKERLYFDEKKRLTRYIDANKAETVYAYNEHDEILSVTNPDGETTVFDYNGFGQITSAKFPTGAVQTIEYDERSRLVKSVMPTGAETVWEYDAVGRMAKIVMPDGVETVYGYAKNGMVSNVTHGEGERKLTTEFEYDASSNLIALTHPTGAREKWEYDKHGNCVKAVNPLGGTDAMEYDKANRLVKHTAGDGNVTLLTYNAYDDVTRLKDNDREISYAYTPLGHLLYRKERNRVIKMNYDTEGMLADVENEAGEKYAFERNGMGSVITETGYDRTPSLPRQSSRRVSFQSVYRRGCTCTILLRRQCGQLSEIKYENGDTETFTHGKIGELLTAENKNSKLEFEYDNIGRVIKEVQNGQGEISMSSEM